KAEVVATQPPEPLAPVAAFAVVARAIGADQLAPWRAARIDARKLLVDKGRDDLVATHGVTFDEALGARREREQHERRCHGRAPSLHACPQLRCAYATALSCCSLHFPAA